MDKGKRPMSSSLYSPLSKEPRQIRLLKIVDTTGENLECEMYPVELNAELEFSALSYVWGNPADPENQAAVTVNGLDTPITKSLESALRHVREAWKSQFPKRPESSFRLWADALCINQKDIPEKSHQVGLMGEIYSRAELVLAWIGPDRGGLLVLFSQSVDLVCRALAANNWVLPKNGQEAVAMLRNHDALILNQKTGSNLRNPEIGSGEWLVKTYWRTICDFLELPNWRRVWVQQEMVLAQKVVVCTSGTTCPVESISLALEVLRLVHAQTHQHGIFNDKNLWAMTELIPPNFVEIYRVSTIFLKRTARRTAPESCPTLTIPYAFSGLECEATDPRDHFFGTLGLCALDLQPDYDKSFGELQIEFVASLFRSEEKSGSAEEKVTLLEFLFCSVNPKLAAFQGAPSWVPFPTRERIPTLHTGQRGNTGFRHSKILENPSLDDRALCLQGTQLGVIQYLYDVNMEHRSSEIHQEWLRAALRPKLLERPIEICTLQTIARLLFITQLRETRSEHMYIMLAIFLLMTVAGIENDGTLHDDALSIRGVLASLGLDLDPERFFESFSKMFGTHEYCQRNRRIRPMLEFMWIYSSTEGVPLAGRGISRLPMPLLSLRHFELAEIDGGALGRRLTLVSKDAQVGDSICVFHGSPNPYVLRKHSEEWRLVGRCETAEIRDGALVEEVELPVGTGVECFRVV